MPNKNAIVIYSGDDWASEQPETGSETTTQALAEWCTFGLQNKINVYRAEIHWYDEQAKVFTKAWTFTAGSWKKITQPITPNVVIDKTAGAQGVEIMALKMALTQTCRMVNHPLFRSLLGSKAAQYLCLGEFMPRSYIASNSRELTEACSQLTAGRVVVKPLHGSGGFGIVIDTPLEIMKKNDITFPVLVQEFKDNTIGVPGFSKAPGLADLRIIFSNHQMIYALSRQAKEKSLFTNIHQGAQAQKVPLAAIPKSVMKITRAIDQRLSFFPYALFTLDFLFDDQERPWLMELNTSPGLDIIYLTGSPSDRAKFFQGTVIKNLI